MENATQNAQFSMEIDTVFVGQTLLINKQIYNM